MTLPAFEVYALRYATVERRARDNFLVQDFADRPMPMDYFVWAIRGGGKVVVVDTGFAAPAAAQRGRRLLRSPAQALAALGIDAAAVQDVVITHLHYDHAGNLGLFPQARLHLQEAEIAHATGRFMAHPRANQPFDVEDVAGMVRRIYAGQVRFHAGEAELSAGITLHRLGGHTQGLQVVRVHTARGWVVLASDAAHFRANLVLRNPFPIFHNLGEVLEGYDRLRALADSPAHIIPGHDPEVLRQFPPLPGHPEIACLHLVPRAAADGGSEP
ncbi:MAG: N-acyl homoserine lactonase family protein [Myxococcales bacterium]